LAVKTGLDFYRLTTPIVSSGDIYESEVSANAIVLGPQSDIARVRVTYFDPNQPTTLLSQAVISPDRSLTGLVPAVNTEQYVSSFTQSNPRKGRVLFSIDDYYDQRFRPATFDGNVDTIAFEAPNLDVIQYFKGLPSVVPQRSDRVFPYQYFKTPTAGNSAWLIVPGYGRKSGFFTFNNLDGLNTVTMRLTGVKLQPTGLGSPAGAWQGALDNAALASNATRQYKYKSSTDGLWDLFCIELENYAGAAFPLTITLSDDPE
jgi:hypothetical protein